MKRSHSPSSYAKDTGARIRAARNARDWSLAVLATKAGVSPASLGSYERGSRGLSVTTLAEIARALGMEARDLLPLLGECEHCGGKPGRGFRCNTCGASG